MALEAELSMVIMLNAEPPLIPENQAVSQDSWRRTNSLRAAGSNGRSYPE